nr:unnamed protein product [Digitaria exilis]
MAHTEIISFLVTAVLFFHSLIPAASVSATTTAHQDQFVFTGFAGANLTLDGTATVTADGLLELTNGSVQLKGHAFLPAPVRFRSSPGSTVRSFSVSFACHGIAFVVAPGTDFSSALAAQYMGLANIDGNTTSRFFATEMDTMQNVEFQDVNNNHAWVDYDGESAWIHVTIAPIGVTTSHSFAVEGLAPTIDVAKLPKLPCLGPKPRSKVLEILLPIATAALIVTLGTLVVILVRRRMRGVLPKSKVDAAVKRVSHESRQGMKEFVAEVVSTGHI